MEILEKRLRAVYINPSQAGFHPPVKTAHKVEDDSSTALQSPADPNSIGLVLKEQNRHQTFTSNVLGWFNCNGTIELPS